MAGPDADQRHRSIELYDRATDADIAGRSKMSKDKLIMALRTAS